MQVVLDYCGVLRKGVARDKTEGVVGIKQDQIMETLFGLYSE